VDDAAADERGVQADAAGEGEGRVQVSEGLRAV
jgi:hypothetical protein